jgi:hypothetical protein
MRIVVIGLALLLSAQVAVAQQRQSTELRDAAGHSLQIDKQVNVTFRKAEVRDIFRTLTTNTDLMIRFAEGANARTQLTLDFRNAQFADVVQHVLEAANLAVESIDGRTIVVSPKRQ